MTATSRRIYLYWLLLIVAALGVGGGAWLLLRREERRLATRASSAEAARRAAVETRARLIAENVELFVGDVEAGLLDTLAEAPVPAEELDAFLDEWERGNPLVRTTFRSAATGALLRPTAANGADEARGFRRRFASRLAEGAPWLPPSAGTKLQVFQEKNLKDQSSGTESAAAKAAEAEETDARRQISNNVANYQRNRKETQELAKAPVPPPAVSSSSAPGMTRKRGAGSMDAYKSEDQPAPAQRAEATAGGFVQKKIRTADRRGWLPWPADGRLHLLGWVQPGGAGEVRGLEMELTAMISRLGGALPAELSVDEGYALRDDKGRVLHQAGKIPAGTTVPTSRVPLASELLPGWEVVAFLTYTVESESGGGFFLIGSLLAGILIVAIVASGSLLLWQAQRSEAEAAQKTSFVANVSHEFKTPLTTIRLYAELLEQGRVAEGPKRNEYLGAIGRETQRLARLVNNVLDFSRLEQGRKKFQCETLDLGVEVARLLDTHEPRVAEAGLTLKRELPPAGAEPVRVVTDRDALEQIVLNLIDNACKYAVSGGEVTVALATNGDGDRAAGGNNGGAMLRVLDRGPGVPADQRERIFEKFHRIDKTLTSEKGGAGLGLSIARQLARGLGGELRCEARPGGGAAFILNLP